MKYAYHPMQMHLHAGHQKGASMASHMYNAQGLGMRYIRITSHDTRTGPSGTPFTSFDFSHAALSYTDEYGLTVGWEEKYGKPLLSFDAESMTVASPADGEESSGVGLRTQGKRHSASLLAEVTLRLTLAPALAKDAGLILDIRLSQRPPDHRPAHLRYVLGNVSPAKTPHTADLPLPMEADGSVTLHLSRDVLLPEVKETVGGLDNAFDSIAILLEARGGAHACCRISRFEISTRYAFDEVIRAQRALAKEVGAAYDVYPFVTTEISGAGIHKNCYTSAVPVIDYAARGYDVTEMEAIAHVKRHGGIFCYNHPFERYKRQALTPEQVAFIVVRDAARFIASGVFGATLMEVAFIGGRHGFGLAEYLRFWDLIGLGGVFITGCGDSDSHESDQSWFSGQNMASWIAAPAALAHPISEEVFTDSMRAGRVYMGDPVHLCHPVDLTAEGAPMGAILTAADRDVRPRRLTLSIKSPDPTATIRIVINGEVSHTLTAGEHTDEGGDLTFSFDLAPTLTVNLARAEMYREDGRCIMLTNPIYLVRTAEYKGELPKERLWDTARDQKRSLL